MSLAVCPRPVRREDRLKTGAIDAQARIIDLVGYFRRFSGIDTRHGACASLAIRYPAHLRTRTIEGSMIDFRVVGRWDQLQSQQGHTVLLRRNNWDDFGFKTLFTVEMYVDQTVMELGDVKILREDQESGATPLPARFDRLGEEYCTVGQSAEYYEKLYGLSDAVRHEYLEAINDVTINSELEAKFRDMTGWDTSLMRFGQAQNALAVGKRLASGNSRPEGRANFTFNWSHQSGITPIPFNFDDTGPLPGRCNVLIGYNGVGKTSLLGDLAMTISRAGISDSDEIASNLEGEDVTFAGVIAVSYSAFDTFKTPIVIPSDRAETSIFGYTYCGLRRIDALAENGESNSGGDEGKFTLKSTEEIEEEFALALNLAGKRGPDRGHLVEAFEALSFEPSFGRIGVDLTRLGSNPGREAVLSDFKSLSTGHKIVLNIVTQLAAHLRTRSLVLVDEPETHLHPPLAAALLRAVQLLLVRNDSFAIIATHSPVVVQEVPAEFVKIIERSGGANSIVNADIETYGESIGAITRFVFSLDSSATDFRGILSELATSRSIDEIDEMFPRGLSTQARALVLNYKAARK